MLRLSDLPSISVIIYYYIITNFNINKASQLQELISNSLNNRGNL